MSVENLESDRIASIDTARSFMSRAISLARLGAGHVSPNPMVGAVIVRDQRVVSEGFHAQYGGMHAEAAAIHDARSRGVELSGTTLYVTLEPCSHYGKTPPCVEAIVGSGIKEVYISLLDPNPLVAGRGVRYLREHGVEVHLHQMEREALFLNRRFFTFHIAHRPYIILKWAQTRDGFIDRLRGPQLPPSRISNRLSRALVHRWRAEEDSIIVGTNTVEYDNPQLTVRYWSGRNPLRITIDRTLRLPDSSHLFDGSTPTLLFTSEEALERSTVDWRSFLDVEPVDFSRPIEPQILDALYSRGVQSLIVEGGTQLLQSFLHQGLWDEARVFVGADCFGRGVKAPEPPEAEMQERITLGDNSLSLWLNSRMHSRLLSFFSPRDSDS